MSVRDIATEDIRGMTDKEGIIFQGCGGEVQEWIDGINDMLTKENILLDGTKFNDVTRFKKGELTCLLFEFNDDVHIDMGKMAIWRLHTHDAFCGTWLSDYISNNFDESVHAEELQDDFDISMDM